MGGVKKAFKKVTSAIGLGGGGDMPKVVARDPEKEAAEAANKAAETANLELAQKKKQRRASSLLSTGGEKGSSDKQTLGG